MDTKNIFVIDDNDIFREMAVDILVRNGYQATEWGNGQDAFQSLENGPLPAVIVTDVNMPKIDGLTLAKNLRENQRYAQIPVVICSNDDMLCTRSQEFSNVYYIDKELSQLISVVDQLMKVHRDH